MTSFPIRFRPPGHRVDRPHVSSGLPPWYAPLSRYSTPASPIRRPPTLARPASYEVAIVTGASSGIGAELALQLAALGVHVGLTARRRDRLEELTGQIQSRGGTAVFAAADAADPEATRQAIHTLHGQLGPVDLLIANAGLGLTRPGSEFSAEEFRQMVAVNLTGAALAIEAVLPEMLERRQGHLVGMSSLAGFRGLPGAAGYCATKAGLNTLLESLRVDLRGTGVDVTTVNPGFVRTPMIAASADRRPFVLEAPEAARRIIRGIQKRRRVVAFPWPMVLAMSLARRLPNALYDRLAGPLVGPL